MKKVLVVLLVLFVGAGLFAQEITPFGSLRLDVGGSSTSTDGTMEGGYKFSADNSGTELGFKVEADAFTGQVQWNQGDKFIGGYGKAVIADVAYLKIAQDHLPSAFWSPLAVFGNSNYSIGASNIGKKPYFQVGYASETLDIHLGAAAPAVLDPDKTETPILFLGVEFSGETFSVGATFNGQLTEHEKGNFPVLATIHGKMGLSEAIALGLNVGFYVAPQNFGGSLGLTDSGGVSGKVLYSATEDKTIAIEALLFAQITLDPAVIAITGGFVDNFAPKEDGGEGMAFQLGVSADIPLNDNFSIIPGVVFQDFLKSAGGGEPKTFAIQYGASMKYKF